MNINEQWFYPDAGGSQDVFIIIDHPTVAVSSTGGRAFSIMLEIKAFQLVAMVMEHHNAATLRH